MVKIISTITLILAILLFPPATLALISNNAVPGDATYPVKRKLEDVILLVASFHPTTKAWFAVERSNRRFQEATILLNNNIAASTTLDELVAQTKSASEEISQVKDSTRKEQLINELSTSIEKYDQGLSQAATPVVPVATPTPTPAPQPSPATPTVIIPPSLPSPSPSPVVSPTASPPAKLPPHNQKDDIDKAREELEKIKKELEEQKRRQRENNKLLHQERSEEKREEKNKEKERKG